MHSKKTVVILGIAACILAAWGIAAWWSSGTAVEAARATKGAIREFVDERAVTRLPETYLITMPFDGRIEPITCQEGTPVQRGQVVAQIVARDLDLRVKQARAAVDRFAANIGENADNTVEETGYRQAVQFSSSVRPTVEAAAAGVTSGKAKLEYAQSNLKRIREAAARGASTPADLDDAILQEIQASIDLQQDQLVLAAMKAIEAGTNLLPIMVRQYIDRKSLTAAVLQQQEAEAEAQLQQVLQNQQRGTMTSPVDGVVLARLISNERFLAAGTSLLEIGRLEDLEVEADVLSLDVVDARIGSKVTIYGPAIGPTPARGAVARIYPAGFTKISSLGVEQQRVKVIVHFDEGELARLRRERNLGVGYRTRVQIITAEKPDALVIPRSALFRGTNGDWQVYAIQGGRAQIVRVKVGLINDEAVEITSGVSEGQQVVLAPESSLVDGARVSASE